MRNLLLCGWLLLPIGAWAYHEGPGQDHLAREEAAAVLDRAHLAASEDDAARAVELYEEALELLPADDLDHARRIRLELNKARLLSGGLPDARQELESLVADLAAEDGADPQLLARAREALANSQYYLTWLMRLEGLQREEWEPQIEAARQNYRLLAECTQDAGMVGRHQEDLESAVRLARLELEDLQGLPLPGQ